jgi:hypothetical protein
MNSVSMCHDALVLLVVHTFIVRIILPLLMTVLFNAIVYGALLVHPGAYFNVPRGTS